MNFPKRYHPAIVVLHWLVAVLVFTNLMLGLIVFPNGSSPLLDGLHMAVGASIFVLVAVRLVFRLRTRLPPDATIGNKYLDLAGKLVHYVLYVVLFTITLIGLDYAFQIGRIQSVFFNIQPQGMGALQIPGIPLRLIHRYLAWLLTALIAGHVSAAVYHQFVRRDNLLSRMWFKID